VTAFLDRYARVLVWVGAGELLIARCCLGTIVLCIFVQVVTRYGFDRPLAWAEELATYAFIWGTFVGASLGLKRGVHLRVETFLGRVRPRTRAAVHVGVLLAMGVLCLLLATNGVKALRLFEWRQRTIALPVELPRYLFFSGPLIVASGSMLLTIMHDLLAAAAGRPLARPAGGEPIT
jgi:TRAP-type C4-dicarboxylate transport system permease small subunit